MVIKHRSSKAMNIKVECREVDIKHHQLSLKVVQVQIRKIIFNLLKIMDIEMIKREMK